MTASDVSSIVRRQLTRARLEPILAFIGPVALLLPFINKAYHIDDPLSLWTAQHIVTNPLRFFDYTLNWTGIPAPAYLVIKNPPLAMYYMAGVGSVLGWSEPVMHGAFLLPAGLTGLGTYYVARRLCSQALLATASAILTPAILVSASNVMTTIVMMALYVWAIAVWFKAMEANRTSLFFLSGLLIAGSALAKYFGISAAPLLFAYTLLSRRRMGWWVAALLMPVVVLLLYDRLTLALFGIALFLDAGSYSGMVQEYEAGPGWYRLFVGAAFAGGSVVSGVFFAPLFGRRAVLGGAALTAGLGILAWLARERLFAAAGEIALPAWSASLQFGLFAAAGVAILILSVYDLWRARSPEAWLLGLWVFGTFVFAAALNWTINARSIMPLAPAAGILIVRHLARTAPERRHSWTHWAPLVPMAALTLALMYADFRLANSGRAAAKHFYAEMPAESGKMYYFGHWGFQYYMKRGSALAVDIGGTDVEPGDILIVPENNFRGFAIPTVYGHRYVATFDVFPWATTWDQRLGAAFYSDLRGKLPYAFGRVPAERYIALLVDEAAHLEDPVLEEIRRSGQLPARP